MLALRVLLAYPRVDGLLSSVISRARAKRCSAEAPHTVWKRQMSAATLLCGGLPSGNRKPSVSERRNLNAEIFRLRSLVAHFAQNDNYLKTNFILK